LTEEREPRTKPLRHEEEEEEEEEEEHTQIAQIILEWPRLALASFAG